MKASFDLTTSAFAYTAVDCQVLENSQYLMLFDGELAQDSEALLELPHTQQAQMNAFIGPFFLLLFDKVGRTLLLTQQLFGSGKQIYFINRDQKIYLASSLKKLKEMAVQPFVLNQEVIPTYIYDSFFPDGQTLIQNVRVLKTGYQMSISRQGIKEERLPFSVLDTPSNTSLEELYQQALSESIAACARDLGERAHLTLSGGFDSNCILFFLRKQLPVAKIETYSVGGCKGVNETVTARKIAQLYERVELHTAEVTEKTLTHLDEITAALEGAVFERGIFLQYELGKMLQEQQVTRMLCGEGADQVFREDTYEPLARPYPHYSNYGTPYEFAASLVLLKNRQMLNYFGVQPRYPFLHPAVLRLGYLTRSQNGRYKAFHKAQLQKILPEKVYTLLGKIGGSTDLAALFPDDFNCAVALKKCRYYSQESDPELCFKGSAYPADMNDMAEAVRKYYLQLLYLESFEKQFCTKAEAA